MPQISERLGLANSTVHGHLKTLEANQLLVKEGNEYHLGLQFFHYGNFTRERKPEYQYARTTSNASRTTRTRARTSAWRNTVR